MRRVSLALVVVAVAAVLWGSTGAVTQDSGDSLTVRLKVPPLSPDFMYGEVLSVSADTLSFRPADSAVPLSVPLGKITSAQVRDGNRNHWVLGTVIGAAVGYLALVGVEKGDMSELAALVQTITTLGGAAVGFTIGMLIRTEGWRDIPPTGLQDLAHPVPGVAVTISFTP